MIIIMSCSKKLSWCSSFYIIILINWLISNSCSYFQLQAMPVDHLLDINITLNIILACLDK